MTSNSESNAEEIPPYTSYDLKHDCEQIQQNLREAITLIEMIHEKCKVRNCTFPSWNSLFCVFLTEESKIKKAFHGFQNEFRRLQK